MVKKKMIFIFIFIKCLLVCGGVRAYSFGRQLRVDRSPTVLYIFNSELIVCYYRGVCHAHRRRDPTAAGRVVKMHFWPAELFTSAPSASYTL